MRTFFDTWYIIYPKVIFFYSLGFSILRGYFGRDFLWNDNNSSKPCPISPNFFLQNQTGTMGACRKNYEVLTATADFISVSVFFHVLKPAGKKKHVPNALLFLHIMSYMNTNRMYNDTAKNIFLLLVKTLLLGILLWFLLDS